MKPRTATQPDLFGPQPQDGKIEIPHGDLEATLARLKRDGWRSMRMDVNKTRGTYTLHFRRMTK